MSDKIYLVAALIVVAVLYYIYVLAPKLSASAAQQPGPGVIVTPGGPASANPIGISPAEAPHPSDQTGINVLTPSPAPVAPQAPVLKVPVVLYSEPNFKGNAIALAAGRNIPIANIGGTCSGKWGDLDCWQFTYKSMQADPGYTLVFGRSSGGHRYAMTVDPVDIIDVDGKFGNIPLLDAHFLESFIPAGSYSNSGLMDKTAVLPYVYWTDPLYLQVVKK